MQVDRRRMLTILGACAAGLCMTGAARPAASCGEASATMRAVWISTVANIDWPSRRGLSVADQQQEYRAILDNAVALRLDTVMVQVRPTADAFWPSPFEPWSAWLTGTQGADPGYDPLAFLVAEAHARGLAFHAWFNPYRVSTQGDPGQLAENHPARRHPDWIFGYGGGLYYDPGLPEVRDFVTSAIMDAVTRYDVDGVHLDDYFYPYPVAGEEIPDGAAFAAHANGFADLGDWRRDNVNQLIKSLSDRVHAAKPGVPFGVSPFGIWRTAAADPRGSATGGTQSFSAIYADTWTWVKQGWLDYVIPQIYWEIGHPVADYSTLVAWWAGLVAGTPCALYVGQAAYKVGSSPAWDDGELARHLAVNARYPQVRGNAYFSATSLATNARVGMERVVAEGGCGPR